MSNKYLIIIIIVFFLKLINFLHLYLYIYFRDNKEYVNIWKNKINCDMRIIGKNKNKSI